MGLCELDLQVENHGSCFWFHFCSTFHFFSPLLIPFSSAVVVNLSCYSCVSLTFPLLTAWLMRYVDGLRWGLARLGWVGLNWAVFIKLFCLLCGHI